MCVTAVAWLALLVYAWRALRLHWRLRGALRQQAVLATRFGAPNSCPTSAQSQGPADSAE
jgi:hypothetical protein